MIYAVIFNGDDINQIKRFDTVFESGRYVGSKRGWYSSSCTSAIDARKQICKYAARCSPGDFSEEFINKWK